MLENSSFRRFLLVAICAVCLAPAFFSCISQKKLERICRERCPRSDSASLVSKDSIVYKDSLIFISVDGPVQFLPHPCANLCDSLGHLKPFEIKTKKNGLSSTIKSRGDTLISDCKADSLEKEIAKIRAEHWREINSKKEDKLKVTSGNERTALDGFYKYSAWMFYLLLIASIVGLVLRHYRDRIKLLEKK